jgi:hypothetical protein
MSVQTSAQPLLVKVVRNETDGTSQHEKTVQDTVLKEELAIDSKPKQGPPGHTLR